MNGAVDTGALVAGDFPSDTISNKFSLDTIDAVRRVPAGIAPAGARDRAVGVGSRAFILLSTYNGEAYVQELLDSLVAQTHLDWVLYWRDDGSSDDTVAIVENFRELVGADRCVRHLPNFGGWAKP